MSKHHCTRAEGRVRLLTFHAQKNVNLGLIAFHGLMSTGCAVAVVPAFQTFSILYHTTLTNASYLGSSQVNGLFAIAMLRNRTDLSTTDDNSRTRTNSMGSDREPLWSSPDLVDFSDWCRALQYGMCIEPELRSQYGLPCDVCE